TCERRGCSRVCDVHADTAVSDRTQRLRQRGHVEHITQAFTIRLQKNWEARKARCHTHQIVGALALLPQRRPAVSSTPWQQKCPARGLAKLRREQRRRSK